MAANTDFLDVSELSFDGIKSNLKRYLMHQDVFKDYNFEGSNINALLDLLSYNTYMNSYYLNMVGSEAFLDSSQMRSSAVSHAKELNYVPRSRTSAEAKVVFNINTGSDAPKFVIIPQYYKLRTLVGQTYVDFTTNQDIVVYPQNGAYSSGPISVYEGKIVTEVFTVTNGKRFIIKSENVDVDSIKVYVQKSATNTTTEQYSKATSLLGVTYRSKVFFVQGYKDNQYEIAFGDGVAGVKVKPGNIVKVVYRSTNGTLGNGVRVFETTEKIEGKYTVTAQVDTIAGNGQERESVDSIKFYAPRHYATQDRAVTVDDYITLIRERYSQIRALQVYGGEDHEPPMYGKIIITLIPKSNVPAIADELKSDMIDYLKTKNITTEPVIVEPEILFAEITSTVYFDPNVTELTAPQIKSKVISQIKKYDTDNLNDFGNDLRKSKLSSYIDAADSSIVSNQLVLRGVHKITPIKTYRQKFDFSFARPLNRTRLDDYGLNEQKVIISNLFSYYNTTNNRVYSNARISDDGKQRLYIYYTTTNGTEVVLQKNIGTVNYNTGRVTFYLTAQDYGASIDIFCRFRSDDITVSKNKFLEIDYSRLSVTVEKYKA